MHRHPLSRFLVGLAVLGFAGLAGLPAANAYVREDVDNGHYLVGSLTWDDGAGGIRWSAVDSDEGQGTASGPGTETYRSDPLPRTIHLNASRLIQVDVYTKDVPTRHNYGSSCATFANITAAAKLGMGSTVLGGDRAQAFYGLAGPHRVSFPEDPPGYGVCRLRFAYEAATLPEGAVLTLDLSHTGYWFPGRSGDHRSIIRIPIFSDEEMPYRYPSYAHGSPPGTDVGSGLGSLLGLLGVAATLGQGLLRGRTRRCVATVGLILLVGALAGCLGGRSSSEGTSAGDGVGARPIAPSYQEGNLSEAGRGSLIGQVRSADVGLPVEGAFAALVGTSSATRTDPYGRFVFRDLAPGNYRLRVDRDGFQPFEGTAEVRPDLIARVDIALIPVATDPDERFHLHDYWGGKDTVVVMDQVDLGYTCPGPTNCNPIASFMIPPSDQGIASILPGTYTVNVTLEWEAARMNVPSAGLVFQANNDPAPANESSLLARGPRTPFRIPTAWEMSDRGHQEWSTWVFKIVPSSGTTSFPDVAGLLRPYQNRLDPPTFKVTVTIEKGVVPLEPAHPDAWKGSNQVQVLTERPNWAFPSLGSDDGGASWNPDHVIPPATTWLEVYANASRDLTVPYDVELLYKTAEDGPCIPCGYVEKKAGVGTVTGRSSRWIVPVLDKEPDPIYAARSFWFLTVSPADDDVTGAKVLADNYAHYGDGNLWANLEYTMAVIAHRDPLPVQTP